MLQHTIFKYFILFQCVIIQGFTSLSGQTTTCEIFREDFNGSHSFELVPNPYGKCNSCTYPQYVQTANDGETERLILGCGDHVELRKNLNYPYGKYKITMHYGTGLDASSNTSDCIWTCYDNIYKTDCHTPKRLIIIDSVVVFEKKGRQDTLNEVISFEYTGTLNNIFLAFSSYGQPRPYETFYDSLVITAAAPVNAGFTFSNNCPGEETKFFDVSDGIPVSWLWNFGDGNTSTEQFPSHQYQNTGDYEVNLKIQTSCGALDSTKVVVPIIPTRTPDIYLDTPVCLGKYSWFLANDEPYIGEYVWEVIENFDTNERGDSMKTAFFSVGQKTASLYFVDTFGCKSNIKNVDFRVLPPILANFTIDQVESVVQLTNTSFSSDSALWDLGNGIELKGDTISYNYPEIGDYKICMTVIKTCDTDVVCKNISVQSLMEDTLINSINQNKLREVLIYPNPARDYIRVVDNNNEIKSYQLFSADGSYLRKGSLSSKKEVNISFLETGTYWIQLIGNKYSSTWYSFQKL